jgi:hypothetical protein
VLVPLAGVEGVAASRKFKGLEWQLKLSLGFRVWGDAYRAVSAILSA